MKDSLELKENFPVSPAVMYRAWLDSKQHSGMTGGEADCSDRLGGAFTAWDGYISGTNVSLVEGREIVQKWRTTEFGESDEDSILTIRLAESPQGCELTLIHTNIPEGQPNYKQGWIDHYFTPMRSFFAG